MRLCRFAKSLNAHPTVTDREPGICYGLLEGDRLRELKGGPFDRLSLSHRTYELAKVRLLPPSCPSKVVCVGRNYVQHVKELGNEMLNEPGIFFKPPSAVIASGDPIRYPDYTANLHYEGEIGVVIRKRCFRIGERPVDEFILGYTCVNDVTARDVQRKDLQWTRAKGFDTACPVGPIITDELDPKRLVLRTFLNGELRQSAGVEQMIFSIESLIRYISNVMTLEPGDLISTGTPSGVGSMNVGDTVVVTVDGIGELRNEVANSVDTLA